MATRRKKGEGSWSKKTIKGIEYQRYRKLYNGEYKEFYGRTVKEVKEKIQEFESRNMYIKKTEVRKQTFGEYLENWFINVRVYEVESSTYLRNEQTINYHIKDSSLYNAQMVNIDSELCQSLINKLSEKYSRSTISKVYVLLNMCFNYAFTKEHIGENPMMKVKMPKESSLVTKKKEAKWLSSSDVEKFVQEAERVNTREFRIKGKVGERVYGVNAYYAILIIYTGLRSGELMALTWEDIDFKNKTLNVNKSRAKGKIDGKTTLYIKDPKSESGTRIIPLSDRAIYALQKIKEYSTELKLNSDNNLIVANTSSESNITRTVKSMLFRAGCETEKCGLHALRHTFGSLLLEKGVDLKTISYLLGHSDITVTANIYLHITREKAINSIEVLNKVNN